MSGEPLAVDEALEEISRIDQHRDALARRTGGVTWMVWGLAAAAIFVTYSYVGVVVDAYGSGADALFPVLWVPWTLLAAVATASLWRSVGLVIPIDTGGAWRESLLTGVVIVGFIFGGLWLVQATGARLLEPATVLLALGAATGGLGLAGVNVTSRVERVAAASAGGFLIVVAVASALVLPADGTGYAWLSLIAPVATAVAYFGVGGVSMMRG